MIIASIFRDDYNSTANEFEKATRLFIANTSGPFQPKEGDSVAIIDTNAMGSVVVRPAYLDESGEWKPKRNGMMGGAYVSTSDSRFNDAIEKLLGHRFYGAVALHDRFEN